MKMRCAVLSVMLIAYVPVAAAQSPSPSTDADAAARRVTALADEYAAAAEVRFAADAAFNGRALPPGARLTDQSPAAMRAWEAREDAWAAELARIDPAPLRGRPEWVTYGYLREAVEPQRALRVCRRELWRVDQMAGWHVLLPRLAGMLPVGTAERRAAALSLYGDLPRYVDTEIANLREGVRRDFTAPRRNAELVLDQLDAMLADSTAAATWAAPAAGDSSPEFRRAWGELVGREIVPAVRRYRDFLRAEYLPNARETIGVSALPDGAACYRAFLRAETGVDRAPAEVFAIAERLVAEREAELLRVAGRVYGVSTVPDFYRRLDADPRNRVTSRDSIFALSRDAIARAEAALPRWFGILPKARVSVEPFPASAEATGSSGQYVPAAEDGSRAAVFYINLSRPEQTKRGGLEVLAFHEVRPGHHLQLSIAQERPALHPISRHVANTGFIEGWGKYAETLADEMGLYTSEIDRLGYLASIPTIMVVDPGIHAMGWTREQAIGYLTEKHPTAPRDFMAAWVDRLAAWPAQAVTYHLGAREFFALREEARRALGPRFDIREFHDRVLEDGTITLPMLREKIERWIAERRKT